MKKNKKKEEFLEQLRKIPIVMVACEKTGISRQSVYRWRTEDDQFRKDMEVAMAEGEALVNDMSESQLLSLIRDKNWPAIQFWLTRRNPKFRDRVEVTSIDNREDKLSPAQEAMVKKALELGSFTTPKEIIL
jgi:predicted DNA binding protein